MKKRLGERNWVKFWVDVWTGEISLTELLPRFNHVVISDIGEWIDVGRRWNLKWRSIFSWKEDIYVNLVNVLDSVNLIKGRVDE